MNIYYDQEIQTKERDSIKNLSTSLQDNNLINNLYSLRH